MKNKPIIIDQDQVEIDKITSAVETALPLLQKAVDEFQRCAFYDSETDLSTIIQNLEGLRRAFIYEQIRAKFPVPEGSVLELDVEAEAKRWKVPTPQLDRAVAEIIQLIGQNGINLSFFMLTNGAVKVQKAVVEKATKRYILTAESDWEQEYIADLKLFAEVSKRIDERVRQAGMIFQHKLHPPQLYRFFDLDSDGNLKPNPDTFRRLKKQMARQEAEAL